MILSMVILPYVFLSVCRGSERLKMCDKDSIYDVIHLVEGSACPSDNCDRPLFEKRRSAKGFVSYLRKVEESAPS